MEDRGSSVGRLAVDGKLGLVGGGWLVTDGGKGGKLWIWECGWKQILYFYFISFSF